MTESSPRRSDRSIPRFHMIGNAHVDPAWMWGWAEGLEAFIATCRSALDRIAETDELIFTCSTAWLYARLERLEPAMFAEIQRCVAAGRWEVVGGWWTEADCNLPSGEGLMRQAEIGQCYFQRAFGRPATVGYSPDAFGHSAGLPQILRQSGLDSYIFCRPDPTELTLPSPLFSWQSSDGSSLPAYRVPFHYNMYQTTVTKKVRGLQSLLPSLGTDEWALFYGVGNHGGGPTKEQIAAIEQIDGLGEVALPFSRLDRFFSAVADRELPVVTGDLQMNAPGTYTSHSLIKRLNRQSEAHLLRAEVLDVLATSFGGESYRQLASDAPERLQQAWQEVCFNHFHDIICGVAIRSALDDAVHRYGVALRTADEVTTEVVRSIARRIDTTGEGETVVVFNPHAFPVVDVVDVELWHDIDKDLWGEPIPLSVTDEEGNEQRVQRIPTEGRIGDDRVGLRFVASLPSVGWRSWRVHYGRSPAHPIVSPFIETSERAIENEHLRIEFPDETGPTSLDVGGPTRLLHKASGLDFLGSGGIEPAIYIDDTDTWGHSKERFDGVRLERFSPTSVRLLETGPVTATVALHTFSATTSISHWYSLHAGSSAIDVLTRIRAVDGAIFLKLLFDTTLEDPETLVAALYDTTTAPCDGRERPGGAWKAMTGRIGGRRATLGISDTMTHGYSAVGSTLMLSLLRTAIYAHHEPHPATLEEDFDRMDVGEIFFRYRIRPIVDEDPAPLLQRDAMIVNGPPIVTVESPHDGGPDRLPREGSLLTCKGEGALVTAMKRETEAESGGVTTRLFDASGNGGSVHVTAADLGIDEEVRLRAHEVRTIRTSNSRSSGEEG